MQIKEERLEYESKTREVWINRDLGNVFMKYNMFDNRISLMFRNFVQEKGMMFNWKVLSVSQRDAVIKEADGNIIVVSSDAAKGYSFVMDYLKMMRENYSGHLRAADILLQRMLGEQYKYIRASERVYRTRLALLSLACGFGGEGEGLDCDDTGALHFRFVPCPVRAVCPMNGYHLKTRGGMACCNPIYEVPFTARQLELAVLLVGTSYAYKDIAELMKIAEGRVKNMASEIYAIIGVCDRQELTVFFQGKRLQ